MSWEEDRLMRKLARAFHVPMWLLGCGTKASAEKNAQLLSRSRRSRRGR